MVLIAPLQHFAGLAARFRLNATLELSQDIRRTNSPLKAYTTLFRQYSKSEVNNKLGLIQFYLLE